MKSDVMDRVETVYQDFDVSAVTTATTGSAETVLPAPTGSLGGKVLGCAGDYSEASGSGVCDGFIDVRNTTQGGANQAWVLLRGEGFDELAGVTTGETDPAAIRLAD